MFWKKKKEVSFDVIDPRGEDGHCFISGKVGIVGEVHFAGTLRVDGKIALGEYLSGVNRALRDHRIQHYSFSPVFYGHPSGPDRRGTDRWVQRNLDSIPYFLAFISPCFDHCRYPDVHDSME